MNAYILKLQATLKQIEQFKLNLEKTRQKFNWDTVKITHEDDKPPKGWTERKRMELEVTGDIEFSFNRGNFDEFDAVTDAGTITIKTQNIFEPAESLANEYLGMEISVMEVPHPDPHFFKYETSAVDWMVVMSESPKYQELFRITERDDTIMTEPIFSEGGEVGTDGLLKGAPQVIDADALAKALLTNKQPESELYC